MTYHQKMTHAIEAAEKWQHEVVHYEDLAMVQAMKVIREKRDRKDRNKPVEMGPVLVAHIKGVLENDTMYHQAVGNRNAQQTLAQMYGTAALVEFMARESAPVMLPARPGYNPCDDAMTGQPHRPHPWSMNGVHFDCPGA